MSGSGVKGTKAQGGDAVLNPRGKGGMGSLRRVTGVCVLRTGGVVQLLDTGGGEGSVGEDVRWMCFLQVLSICVKLSARASRVVVQSGVSRIGLPSLFFSLQGGCGCSVHAWEGRPGPIFA